MPKKYIQLLLSMNFCLTAVSAIANSDIDKNITSTSLAESFIKEVKDQFDQIWNCLEEINTIYESDSLKEFIQKNKNIEIPYDENSEEISQSTLSKQYGDFLNSLAPFWKLPEQNLNEVSKNKLLAQKEKINSCLGQIGVYYHLISQKPSAKEENFFCINQCKKFQNISFDEIMKSSILEEESPTPQITNSPTENNQNSNTVFIDKDHFLPPPKIATAPDEDIDLEYEEDHFLPPPKIATTPDEDIDLEYEEDHFLPDPKITTTPDEDIDLEHEEDEAIADSTPDSVSSIETALSTQFYHIWHHLEKIHQIYPSELLQRSISKHQKSTIQYDENKLQTDLMQDITDQFSQLCLNLEALSNYAFKEKLDERSKAILDTQFTEIHNCLDRISKLYQTKGSLSKKDQLFLNHQLEELLVLSQNFITEEEDKETLYLTKREADLTPEFSSTRIELDNQFNQIWNCLDKMNAIHQSDLLQKFIFHHRDEKIPYNESLDEISEETLEGQFIQLHEALEICSQYQPKEELDEDSKAKLGIQLDQIEHCLKAIHDIYRNGSLSKEEKAFLRAQLEKLQNFTYYFIAENSPQEENADRVGFLDKIQTLLNSCEKEDNLIYPQYEYIMNGQEANISNLLTSSNVQNNTQSKLLYFNKEEGLIELEHIEELLDREGTEEYTDPYITTWKIRSADATLVKDWKKNNVITIDKTSIFSRYTMFGESLEYTLTNTNHNKSVRANFVCKSLNENTYTILSIDYLENIVILENGPCLFVQVGDLKEWHVKDTVVLQRFGSVTDTNKSHQLINKTRSNKTNWVSLKEWR